MLMQVRHTLKRNLTRLLVLCFLLLSYAVSQLPAQNTEAGSVTTNSTMQTDANLPSDLEHKNQASEEKKDERPRELGVMLLIVWLLLGTGVGILIFTSLFGHSVRGMIRRPYPTQSHPEPKSSPEPSPDSTDESEIVEEEPKP